jgi:CheY-like chemotaxis protein
VGENAIDRLLVRQPLEGWGFSVVEAASAQEALYQLSLAKRTSLPFRMLIVDHQAPGMDGWGVALEIKSSPGSSGLPIVMLTGGDQTATARRCRDLGFANYLLKPLRRAQLFKVMSAALGSLRNHAGPSPARQAAPYRVLLCEDSQDNAFLIRAYLEGAPYVIEHARDGQAGFDLFRTESFDVVLMDVQMPVLDGHAATLRMRQWEAACQRRPTPIIALTAHAFKEEEDLCVSAGCTAFLSKPIRKATLLSALARHCTNAECAQPEFDIPPEVQALVSRYKEGLNRDLRKLSEALSVRNFDAIRIIGHNMKGAGASYGFPQVTAAGALIEAAAISGDDAGIRLSLGAMQETFAKN